MKSISVWVLQRLFDFSLFVRFNGFIRIWQ